VSAQNHRKYAISPGAELLEHVLETPSHRRPGNATNPPADERRKPSALRKSKLQPRAAGATQPSTPISVARGTSLPVVAARLWDCGGLRPDFYMGNCPDCGSTRSVEMLPRVNICSCGNPFFAEMA